MVTSNATPENAQYLASRTGLDPAVAMAWLKNEGQSKANPTNPLNILWGNTRGRIKQEDSRFAAYPTTKAGLDDAAWLINNSSYYSGIRAAIATGDPKVQARAIELSPWAAGHYGGGSGPGNISRTLGTVGTVAAGPKALTRDVLAAGMSAVGIPTDDSHRLTAFEASKLKAYLEGRGYATTGIATNVILLKLKQELGQPNSFFPGTTEAINKALPEIPDIPGAIGAFGNTVIKVTTYMIALAVILVGIWLYSKGSQQPMGVPSGE